MVIGHNASELGDHKKALDYFHRALKIRKAIGDRGGEATLVDGVVSYISADRLNDPGQAQAAPYYSVQVKVDAAEVAKLGKDMRLDTDIKLAPGMPVTVFIKTRERAAIMYLLEPVTDTLRKAFRES